MRRTPAGMEIDEMKRIVVDSSASLYKLDGIDFASVPLKIVTDEREYLDDGTLDAVEMATALRTYKGKTSTSCPNICLLYTSPSPRDQRGSRMPSSA